MELLSAVVWHTDRNVYRLISKRIVEFLIAENISTCVPQAGEKDYILPVQLIE